MGSRTKAQREADRRYNAATAARYSVFSCKVKVEEAELFKKKCVALGTTPNRVFREAIAEIMKM